MKKNLKKIEQLIRPKIRALSAYRVPTAGEWIKMDAMENPYSLPTSLQQEWLKTLSQVAINRYPDPTASALVKQLRSAMEVPAESDIVLGN